MGRIQREDVAFPSSPDTRFGGNIARANVGAQYPRGGHDIRYEEYMAPHRVDYTRNVPQQTGTPNFRGPIQGTSTFPHELQHQGALRQHQGALRQHPNLHLEGPRMRGMGGGLGGLQEQAAIDPSDWRSILRIIKAGGNPDDYIETAEGYGPFISPSTLEGDRLESEGWYRDEDGRWMLDTNYPYDDDDILNPWASAARGGLMSLRR